MRAVRNRNSENLKFFFSRLDNAHAGIYNITIASCRMTKDMISKVRRFREDAPQAESAFNVRFEITALPTAGASGAIQPDQ